MEDYVTYKQAVELKELGFDWECYTFYHWDNWCGLNHSGICENHNMFEKCISAPTLAQAQKWLREKHRIHIQIEACMGHKWTYELVDTYCRQDITGEYISRIPERDSYPLITTYEQALSEGISKALELLK